jgi:hypothetical protein
MRAAFSSARLRAPAVSTKRGRMSADSTWCKDFSFLLRDAPSCAIKSPISSRTVHGVSQRTSSFEAFFPGLLRGGSSRYTLQSSLLSDKKKYRRPLASSPIGTCLSRSAPLSPPSTWAHNQRTNHQLNRISLLRGSSTQSHWSEMQGCSQIMLKLCEITRSGHASSVLTKGTGPICNISQ